jgi:D-3-phosphoglycerate dehydrogenase
VDVYSAQPLAPDHPFRDLDNMLLSPHVAALTRESSVAMSVGTARQLLQLLRCERPEHLVNDEVWAGWLRARAAE